MTPRLTLTTASGTKNRRGVRNVRIGTPFQAHPPYRTVGIGLRERISNALPISRCLGTSGGAGRSRSSRRSPHRLPVPVAAAHAEVPIGRARRTHLVTFGARVRCVDLEHRSAVLGAGLSADLFAGSDDRSRGRWVRQNGGHRCRFRAGGRERCVLEPSFGSPRDMLTPASARGLNPVRRTVEPALWGGRVSGLRRASMQRRLTTPACLVGCSCCCGTRSRGRTWP